MSCEKNAEKKAVVKNKGVLFCFTDFSNRNIEKGYKKIYEEFGDMIRGIAWGVETCPKTKKKHNQGYIQVYKQCRYTAIQKWFMSKCHFEVCMGSIKQNEDYCSKEQLYTKLGKFVSRGYRSDMHNIKDDLHNGAEMYDIMNNYTGDYVRYTGGISKMKSLIDKKRRQRMGYVKPNVIARCGRGESGKTKEIFDKHGYENVFKISRYDDLKFMFNGYDNEKVLLMDDFDGTIPYTYLLQLLDGYPMDINVKNGVCYNFFTTIYITSNNMPHKWYYKFKWNLARRLTTCLKVCKGNTTDFTQQYKYLDSDEHDKMGYDSE